jgi:hypothetical protein
MSRRFGAARPPRLDGLVEGLDGSPGRQPDARGVDVDTGGLELLLRGFQTQQTDLLLDAMAWSRWREADPARLLRASEAGRYEESA